MYVGSSFLLDRMMTWDGARVSGMKFIAKFLPPNQVYRGFICILDAYQIVSS